MSYCTECNGDGNVSCTSCGGDGLVGGNEHRLCPECHGSGYTACPDCQGDEVSVVPEVPPEARGQ